MEPRSLASLPADGTQVSKSVRRGRAAAAEAEAIQGYPVTYLVRTTKTAASMGEGPGAAQGLVLRR